MTEDNARAFQVRATSFSGYFSRGKTKRTMLAAQPSFSCGLVSSWHITHALARHVASPSVGIYARLRMQTRSNLTDVSSKAEAALLSSPVIARFSAFSRLYCATKLLRRVYAPVPFFYGHAIKRTRGQRRLSGYVV